MEDALTADFKDKYADISDYQANWLANVYAASFTANNRDVERETGMEAARDQDGREEASEKINTDAGVKIAESQGIAEAEKTLPKKAPMQPAQDNSMSM